MGSGVAQLLLAQGKRRQAKPVLQKQLTRQNGALGSGHPSTVRIATWQKTMSPTSISEASFWIEWTPSFAVTAWMGAEPAAVVRLDQGPHRTPRGPVEDGAALIEQLPNQPVPRVPKLELLLPLFEDPAQTVAGIAGCCSVAGCFSFQLVLTSKRKKTHK